MPAGKFSARAEEVRRTANLLRNAMEMVKPVEVPDDSCRDPHDLRILGTLMAAGADCLVSGDHDLLEIKAYRSVPILSPRAFYDRLGK